MHRKSDSKNQPWVHVCAVTYSLSTMLQQKLLGSMPGNQHYCSFYSIYSVHGPTQALTKSYIVHIHCNSYTSVINPNE